MTIKLVTLAFISLFSFQSLAVMPHESGSKKAPFAVEIRYFSIGTGIDNELKEQIENIIGFKGVTQKIEYIRTSGWGREGESTVCVQLKSYKDAIATFEELTQLASQSSKNLTKITLLGDCDPRFVTKNNE